ncbi:transglycosylase domain-containing protein [Streptomyces sp. MS06]|uniref:transglycosylase domain-containing protein n=1 Tax=Streptomyces sp. MS06 TaxID=3385974 RepID=UPI0039A31E39
MSEHRRKPPQPPGGGRAAARRGPSGSSSGRRAAPRGTTGSSAGSYRSDSDGGDSHGPDPYGSGGEERPYSGRADARRQRNQGSRRRAAEPARGSRRSAPGRGRTGPPARKRFIDYPRAGKYGWQRWVPSWKLVSALFVGFFGSMVAVAGIGYAMVGVPNVDKTATAENNVYYWADNTPMVATGGETNRQIVDLSQIPKAMQHAVVSQENKTFYTDSGIDPKGIARAVFNMARGGETQGGSTITQQYVKNAMLADQSQTLSRKFKEIFVSIKVGATVKKDDIMAGYLNSAYYGRNAYGIQAAARAYFNKDAVDLNQGECAFLAAMLKGATYYDPAGSVSIDPSATPQANSQRALHQMQDTLDKMVEYGYLSPTDRAKFRTLPKWQNPRSNTRLGGQIGYLVDLAKGYLINNTDITADDLQRGGYSIYTTFDKKKVQKLESVVKKYRKKYLDPKKYPKYDTYVQFGAASVNPETGAIVAVYGGQDATKHFTNNADVTGAQVGSTFKPFVLAAAMKWGVRDPEGPAEQAQDERTIASPKSLYSGRNGYKVKDYRGDVWKDDKGNEWRQTNDDEQSYGSPPDYRITLREAMRWSVNSPFVQLGMDVGLDKVKESALDAGLLKQNLTGTHSPSFSIGISDPSAIRMAGAYATFAASGKQRDPFSVTKVTSKDGQVFEHKDVAKQAFTEQVADNVTDVLKTVVEKGTGTHSQLPGREVAGKTGTTDGNKSAWFVGYTPQLSTAVSMFRLDDNEKNKERKFLEMYNTGRQPKVHGASFPSWIWHDYMIDALKGMPKAKFPKPESIGEVLNDLPSPTPTPSATETQEASPTPSPSPSPSKHQGRPSPSPTTTCSGWSWKCGPTDGGTGGITPQPTGSTSASPSPTPTSTSKGRGGSGTLFGGPGG